jgi:hypothetical protein
MIVGIVDKRRLRTARCGQVLRLEYNDIARPC